MARRFISLLLALLLVLLSLPGLSENREEEDLLDASLSQLIGYFTLKGHRLTVNLTPLNDTMQDYVGSILVWLDQHDQVFAVQAVAQDEYVTSYVVGTPQERGALAGYFYREARFVGISEPNVYVGRCDDVPDFENADRYTLAEVWNYLQSISVEKDADFSSLMPAEDVQLEGWVNDFYAPAGQTPRQLTYLTLPYAERGNIYQDLINRMMTAYLCTSTVSSWQAGEDLFSNYPTGIFIDRIDEPTIIFVRTHENGLALIMQNVEGEFAKLFGLLYTEMSVLGAEGGDLPFAEVCEAEDGSFYLMGGGVDNWLSDDETIFAFLYDDYNLFGAQDAE
ncbi:MAG: hypothetical protein IJ083_12420 [Clostridia bacterium]|nr:hypothetical protein [Clostridia bacterium]